MSSERGTTPRERRRRCGHLSLARVAGGELGRGRPLHDRLAGPLDAARPRDSAVRVSRCHRRRAPRPDRRRARQIAARSGPRRGRGHRHRAVGPQLGARLRRALAGRRRCGAPVPATLVRAPQHVHARAGAAPGARRPARSADRRRRARRGRRGARDRGRGAPTRSTEPGRSRSSRGAAGCCSPRAATSRARSRASSARSPSTLAARIRSSTRGRCSPSAGRSGARSSAAPPARRSRTRSHASNGSARRSGPSRRAAELARIGGRAPSRGELTEAERRIAATRRRGQHEPRGCGGPLPHRALRRDGADACLSQARRPLPRRARAPAGRKELRFPAFAATGTQGCSLGQRRAERRLL